MNRQENLVNVMLQHKLIDYGRLVCYLLSDFSHNDDTRTILKDLLGNINFRITRNLQTPQALITCSFEHSSKISTVHIFVLMPQSTRFVLIGKGYTNTTSRYTDWWNNWAWKLKILITSLSLGSTSVVQWGENWRSVLSGVGIDTGRSCIW